MHRIALPFGRNRDGAVTALRMAGKAAGISRAESQSSSTSCSIFGNVLHIWSVQVIAKRTLKLFWERHPQAEMPLRAWHAMSSRSEWSGPADVKAAFGASVDFVADNRLIFDVAGNKYRLIVHVAYAYKRVLIKFVGTHAEYDKIDPETV
jgi:mRNA interferase HigB